jgi:hypothetical protein
MRTCSLWLYRLPSQSDRSLEGLIEFLVRRIVRGEANPWAPAPARSQHHETDEEGIEYEDDLYDAGVNLGKNSEVMNALRTYVPLPR